VEEPEPELEKEPEQEKKIESSKEDSSQVKGTNLIISGINYMKNRKILTFSIRTIIVF
jgi:hypothetical protein